VVISSFASIKIVTVANPGTTGGNGMRVCAAAAVVVEPLMPTLPADPGTSDVPDTTPPLALLSVDVFEFGKDDKSAVDLGLSGSLESKFTTSRVGAVVVPPPPAATLLLLLILEPVVENDGGELFGTVCAGAGGFDPGTETPEDPDNDVSIIGGFPTVGPVIPEDSVLLIGAPSEALNCSANAFVEPVNVVELPRIPTDVIDEELDELDGKPDTPKISPTTVPPETCKLVGFVAIAFSVSLILETFDVT
jgi:hypothetical protein